MKFTVLKYVIRFHFITLCIAIINVFLKKYGSFSFENTVEFGIEISVLVSGVILFLFHLKPFRGASYYFSFYGLSVILFVAGFLFKDSIFSLFALVLVYFIVPDEKKVEENGISVYFIIEGAMAPCCNYQVKTREFFIFEKSYGNIELEEQIDFETMSIVNTEREIELTYSVSFSQEIFSRRIKK